MKNYFYWLTSGLFVAIMMVAVACDEVGNKDSRNLPHAKSEKFVGREGIKRLCEQYLNVRYLDQPEIHEPSIKNKTAADLSDPSLYAASDELLKKIRSSHLAGIYVQFINEHIGYGLFAHSTIKKGELIGEYTGEVKNSNDVSDTTWAWRYPSYAYKDEAHVPDISVDGRLAGNGMRFANHSDEPNTITQRVFADGFLRILYVATKDIGPNEQITVSYGSAYWKTRNKAPL